MGKFIITKRTNGEFQFNLKAGNGQSILSSEGYTTRTSCEAGIASVKKNAQIDTRFERKTSTNGKPYFNLKASNGQVIGNSEMYESESSREAGISSVMKNAGEAVTEDQTLEQAAG
ncbi:YegP family protein [Pedobacter immunditicola]|uniref:YegP family protein n=1 Tax=Pedobacter immunditicola TaxID=3133440 RepID=UPI0030A5E2AE